MESTVQANTGSGSSAVEMEKLLTNTLSQMQDAVRFHRTSLFEAERIGTACQEALRVLCGDDAEGAVRPSIVQEDHDRGKGPLGY